MPSLGWCQGCIVESRGFAQPALETMKLFASFLLVAAVAAVSTAQASSEAPKSAKPDLALGEAKFTAVCAA
ncbi:MAG: hypothetical protein EBR27_05190, partial [Betaproteobacteria bacterium]|nr:hypothetical protein [Betaproteobacteria bacterium]